MHLMLQQVIDTSLSTHGTDWTLLILGILVAIAIPLHELDRNVFMSYNFEANYNMVGQPADSVPGPPYVRWKLGSTYEDMSVNPTGDVLGDSSIARSLHKGNDTVEQEEEATTEESNRIDDDETNEIRKRSLMDRVVLSRKGVYRVLESRITA